MKLEVKIKDVVDFYNQNKNLIGNISVETPFGYKRILGASKTDTSIPILIQTENENSCISSKNHRYKVDNQKFKYAKNLKIGDSVLTKFGKEKIINILKFKKPIDLYDIEVEEVHQYYSNNIISHNSSLFSDAIVFALFGKTLKNTNNKYIPNRNVSEKLKPYVKVYLRSDGQLYSIESYGRVVAGIMSTLGMEVLKLNDDYSVMEDLTQSSVNKTKQYIQDNIIGCTFDIFKSSIIISSSDFMNFFEGMNKDAKRKYIENIFNLNCFGEMYSLVKADINDIKKEIQFMKAEMLKDVDSISDLENKFNSYNEKALQIQENTKNKILEKYNELQKLKEEKEGIKYSEVNDLNKQLKEINEKINVLEKERRTLEKQNIEAKAEIKHSVNLINELKKIKDGLCEKCKALMDERYDLSHNVETINKLKKDIENNESIINDKKTQLDSLRKEYDNISDEYDDNILLIQKVEKLSMSIKYISNEIKTLKAEYDNNKENNKNPFEELLNNAKAQLKSLKIKLIEYNKNLKHLDILKDACSENGVKRFILKDIVKLLNSLIQKYLNEIGSEMIVYFDETMEFKFLTQSGECEFSSFSAGEKQRIQISTMLAFRDLILNSKIFSNLFIIDEMLDMNIDTICIENIMKILKRQIDEKNQSVFIISHRSELADNEGYWNNIIKVTKENGISTYEVI